MRPDLLQEVVAEAGVADLAVAGHLGGLGFDFRAGFGAAQGGVLSAGGAGRHGDGRVPAAEDLSDDLADQRTGISVMVKTIRRGSCGRPAP
jgi:hypothetical protein